MRCCYCYYCSVVCLRLHNALPRCVAPSSLHDDYIVGTQTAAPCEPPAHPLHTSHIVPMQSYSLHRYNACTLPRLRARRRPLHNRR